jgi:GntR family transcriptional regulator, transcriptional repressor for pyruvate dehydrogenase complex
MRKKLFEEVSTGLLEMIRTKQILPGERIPTESEIADMFQVSRTAVREGVKTLTAVGMLKTRPGIGTFVVDMPMGPLRNPGEDANGADLPVLLDLLEFRRIVEPETAALAAQRRLDADVETLEDCVNKLEQGIQLHIKPAEDIGFHLALAHAARNSALLDATYLIFRFYENDPSLPDQSDLISHRSVYEAVRDEDPVRARLAMLDHFTLLEKRYRANVHS